MEKKKNSGFVYLIELCFYLESEIVIILASSSFAKFIRFESCFLTRGNQVCYEQLSVV